MPASVPRPESDPQPTYGVDLVARADIENLERRMSELASLESVQNLERRVDDAEEHISEVRRNSSHMEISWREAAAKLKEVIGEMEKKLVPLAWIERFAFAGAMGVLSLLGIAIWQLVVSRGAR